MQIEFSRRGAKVGASHLGLPIADLALRFAMALRRGAKTQRRQEREAQNHLAFTKIIHFSCEVLCALASLRLCVLASWRINAGTAT
jgi:hypothetical protein